MSLTGPQLPPQMLPKRKRVHEEGEEDGTVDDKQSNTPRKKTSSPLLSTKSDNKRCRTKEVPTHQAPLDIRQNQRPDASEDISSDEDDYGPSLPFETKVHYTEQLKSSDPPQTEAAMAQDTVRARRDEWMLVPPKQGEVVGRMDPTKIRARKFNTGKTAKIPYQPSADNTVWTETSEQKRKRLEDEVLGKAQPAEGSVSLVLEHRTHAEEREMARKARQHNEKHRTKSLYAEHQAKPHKEIDDDPSQRAFDYEKDMGNGRKIGHVQKREMLSRASNYGSRFSSGSYL